MRAADGAARLLSHFGRAEMAIRLTKKRMARLHTAISLDDILHEKYRRMHEELQREAQRLFRHRRNIHVVQRRGNVMHVLRVIDVRIGPDFTEVVVD